MSTAVSNMKQLETLFTEHSDMVYRICLRYTKNSAESQDLVQDIFLKIHDNLGRFKGKSSYMTWIYRIAVNYCLDNLRGKKRRNELNYQFIDDIVISNLGSQVTPSLVSITLEKVLSEADPQTREILYLAYTEGLSHEEIGNMMGVNRLTIQRKLAKFRDKIQKKYGPELNGSVSSIFFVLILRFFLMP